MKLSGGLSDPTPKHLLSGRLPNYDTHPSVPAGSRSDISCGFDSIATVIRRSDPATIFIETYTGVLDKHVLALIDVLAPDSVISSAEALKTEAEIDLMVSADVTDDPVFGYMTRLRLDDFFDGRKVKMLKDRLDISTGRVVVYGPGASLLGRGDVLVYADMPRWEGQLRQRRGEAANLGTSNFDETASLQYKRSYFVDWRVLDRHKQQIWERIDYFLDTTDARRPKMVAASSMRRALQSAARAPLRVVPYFDPAPWGGRWIEKVCDVEHDGPNLGWCFDCVPEENSLLLAYGDERFEIPSINLVFAHPKELLGTEVYGRFGREFPIRFDFLDTMGGGNLSLQVHPPTEYIQQTFGMHYTQDESYYLLDAGPDATVYLGLKSGVDVNEVFEHLRRAESEAYRFPDERFINRLPAKRHDHFLIPAGTVHCSGTNSMVLEISATPYIFTFKLWDWDRLGLNGRPRPVHLDHGENSVDACRDTAFVEAELVNQVRGVAEGDGWVEESTGLHDAEFIETRRHWFVKDVEHQPSGLNVLNLVEGEDALVTSPDGSFEPFPVHYAETFIVPAAAGPYVIGPGPGSANKDRTHATIKALVRSRAR